MDEDREPVEIPLEALGAGTLRAILEEFVTRDGTDYGAVERSLDEKVADVRRQLERGEVRILFDPGTQSVTVAPVQDPG